MPSEKRARQRAMRQVKVEQVQKHKRRSRRLRRLGGAALVVAVVIGVIALVSQHSPTSAVAPVCLPKGHLVAATRHTKFTTAPPTCISKGVTYDAKFTTDVGSFVVAMPPSEPAKAVNNFVFLAEHRFYDGTKFHRVIPGFVVQGGSPNGTSNGGPGYEWTGSTPPAKCSAAKDCYPAWSVAYANSSGPATNGSQFFIVLPKEAKDLDSEPDYTLFGTVISGRPVLNRIAKDGGPAPTGKPKHVHHLISVTITAAAS